MNHSLLKALAMLKNPSMAQKKFGKAFASGPAGKGYMDAVTPGAESVQDALVKIIGTDGAGTGFRSRLGGMAASDEMLGLLQAMPAAGGLYAGTAVADAVGDAYSGLTGQETSFADNGMDLLGMGAGAGAVYGLNRGTNKLGGTTRAGAALAAAGAGKLGVDILQGLF